MTDTNYTPIRIRLENEHKRLNEQLEAIRAVRSSEKRREGSPFGKREEEATETADLENMIAQEKRLVDQLVNIETSLKKFENGTFGICEKCGQSIESVRMEAMPTARLCISDAQKATR
ncbi:MAG: TraR/DksA C4-type zinc finger protein [Dehalococcoidia bacterium]|nr:TraR/DksA C4-type zinc finger protein [Dehalococcoidia bacterium]